jgi:hypothetical protein
VRGGVVMGGGTRGYENKIIIIKDSGKWSKHEIGQVTGKRKRKRKRREDEFSENEKRNEYILRVALSRDFPKHCRPAHKVLLGTEGRAEQEKGW